MKIGKLPKLVLFMATAVASSAFGVAVLHGENAVASADGTEETTIFKMMDGTSLRYSDDEKGGLRFRVQMDENVKTTIESESTTFGFIVAPTTYFEAVTDGDYSKLTDKLDQTAEKSTIYQDGEYYYSNCVIVEILEKNRILNYNAVAYYTVDGSTTYAKVDVENGYSNYYALVDKLAKDTDEAANILADKAYTWYGTEAYPITVDTLAEYNALAAVVNGGVDYSAKYVKIADGVATEGRTEINDKSKFPQIIKTAPQYTAPTANTLTYTGSAQALVNAGTATGGTMQYKLGADGEYSDAIPTATNAGEYTVYYKVVGDANHNDVAEANLTITIAKAANAITTLTMEGWAYGNTASTPTAKATFGEATFTYATSENGEYTASVPTNAGTYYVKAVVAGTDNYAAAEKTASFTIEKAAMTITAPTAKTGLTYNGAEQELVNAGTVTGGTMKYRVGTGDYTTGIPVELHAGTYTVEYIIEADSNHKAADGGSVQVTIAKKEAAITTRQEFNLVTATSGKANADLTEVYGEAKTAEIDISSLFGQSIVTIEQTDYIISLPVNVYSEYDATSANITADIPVWGNNGFWSRGMFFTEGQDGYIAGGSELRMMNSTTSKTVWHGASLKIKNAPATGESRLMAVRMYIKSELSSVQLRIMLPTATANSDTTAISEILTYTTNTWVTYAFDYSTFATAWTILNATDDSSSPCEYYIDYIRVYDAYDMSTITTGRLTAGGSEMTSKLVDAADTSVGGTGKLLSMEAKAYGTKSLTFEQAVTSDVRSISVRLYISSTAASVDLIFIPVDNAANKYDGNVQKKAVATNQWVEITLSKSETANFVKDGALRGIGFGVWQGSVDAGTTIYIDYIKAI